MDSVVYFNNDELRRDASSNCLRLDFGFTDGGTNFSASFPAVATADRSYQQYQTALMDNSTGDSCGWISFDVRRLTAEEKAAEDKNYADWSGLTSALQAIDKTNFANMLGKAWASIITHYLTEYPSNVEALVTAAQEV